MKAKVCFSILSHVESVLESFLPKLFRERFFPIHFDTKTNYFYFHCVCIMYIHVLVWVSYTSVQYRTTVMYVCVYMNMYMCCAYPCICMCMCAFIQHVCVSVRIYVHCLHTHATVCASYTQPAHIHYCVSVGGYINPVHVDSSACVILTPSAVLTFNFLLIHKFPPTTICIRLHPYVHVGDKHTEQTHFQNYLSMLSYCTVLCFIPPGVYMRHCIISVLGLNKPISPFLFG